jgi:hypothetical protein
LHRTAAVAGSDLPATRERQRDDDPEDEPADVAEERDASAVGRGAEESEVCLDQLAEEPGAEENQAESWTGNTTTSPRTVELG